MGAKTFCINLPFRAKVSLLGRLKDGQIIEEFTLKSETRAKVLSDRRLLLQEKVPVRKLRKSL